jgi:hypothetical protein
MDYLPCSRGLKVVHQFNDILGKSIGIGRQVSPEGSGGHLIGAGRAP